MSTRPTRTTLGCESLETRENPAGNVNVFVFGGTISAFGDNFDNQISIRQSRAGDVFVVGLNGTAVNGRASVFLGRFIPTGVFTSMGAGRDATEIVGLFSGGNIEMHGGAGGDLNRLVNVGAAGIIRVFGESGNDTTVLSGVQAGNNIQLDGGTEFDIFHIDNTFATNGVFVDNQERQF